MRLLIEAIVVGVITVLVSQIVTIFYTNHNELPEICKSWNKNYVMEKSLFFIGFVTHLLCQVVGINKWYCTHGVACVTN
jgi:hypothetical protein